MQKQENSLRVKIIKASYLAGACHIGSALSCSDIVEAVYKVKKPEDIFLFSKASGVAALYCYLYPLEEATEYLRKYPLANKEVPGVVHSVGSVGMGLSVAVGLALGDRSRDVYCLISDGQLNEGVTYEAALFAKQHHLTNLYVIVDNNGIQACDRTDNVLNLDTAIEFFQKTFPHFENVKTIKGKGVSFLENKVESHYMNLTKELYEKAIEELCKI